MHFKYIGESLVLPEINSVHMHLVKKKQPERFLNLVQLTTDPKKLGNFNMTATSY